MKEPKGACRGAAHAVERPHTEAWLRAYLVLAAATVLMCGYMMAKAVTTYSETNAQILPLVAFEGRP